MIRLFASDMDGTLLGPGFVISQGNGEAIHRFQQAGGIFVIATGRIRYDAECICKGRGLKPYIISNNGTCVSDPEGRVLHENPLSVCEVKEFCTFLEENDLCYGFGEKEAFIAPENWETVLESEFLRLRTKGKEIPSEKEAHVKAENREQNGLRLVRNIKEYMQGGPSVYSISVLTYDEEKIQKLRELAAAYEQVRISISGTHNVEIMRKNGTKGHAIKFLREYLGISVEQTAAIGDGLNDFEMLHEVGLRFAPENACAEIKAIAHRITASCQKDGVADAISYMMQKA